MGKRWESDGREMGERWERDRREMGRDGIDGRGWGAMARCSSYLLLQ
jgi:hypothetical protein